MTDLGTESQKVSAILATNDRAAIKQLFFELTGTTADGKKSTKDIVRRIENLIEKRSKIIEYVKADEPSLEDLCQVAIDTQSAREVADDEDAHFVHEEMAFAKQDDGFSRQGSTSFLIDLHPQSGVSYQLVRSNGTTLWRGWRPLNRALKRNGLKIVGGWQQCSSKDWQFYRVVKRQTKIGTVDDGLIYARIPAL